MEGHPTGDGGVEGRGEEEGVVELVFGEGLWGFGGGVD